MIMEISCIMRWLQLPNICIMIEISERMVEFTDQVQIKLSAPCDADHWSVCDMQYAISPSTFSPFISIILPPYLISIKTLKLLNPHQIKIKMAAE